jgi:hypothetical protein
MSSPLTAHQISSVGSFRSWFWTRATVDEDLNGDVDANCGATSDLAVADSVLLLQPASNTVKKMATRNLLVIAVSTRQAYRGDIHILERHSTR